MSNWLAGLLGLQSQPEMGLLGQYSLRPLDAAHEISRQMANPEPQGFWGRLNAGLDDRSGMLLGLGGALLAHGQDATRPIDFSGAMQGALIDEKRRDRKEEKALKQNARNQSIGYAVNTLGLPEQAATQLADADLLGSYIGEQWRAANRADDSPADAKLIRWLDQDPKRWDAYQRMKAAGREGGDGSSKPPSGFRWGDETGTWLEPIPGGPGKQISGEVSARIGMTDNFLKSAPDIRKRLQEGRATGLIDRTNAGWFDATKDADVLRDLRSGTDALQRQLTGAGMPASEAAEYAKRYQPSYTDTIGSATEKFDRLVAELESISATAMRGRGSPPGSGGGRSGGRTGGAGSTSSGVNWRAR